VLVPRHPGNFSALGLLVSDVKHDDVRTRVGILREGETAIISAVAEMRTAVVERLSTEGFAASSQRIETALDLRYLGQAFELTVALPPGPPDLPAIARDFHERHRATYGHADPGGEVELVNVRLTARGIVDKPLPAPLRPITAEVAPAASRSVWFDGQALSVDVFERDTLRPRTTLRGPAILEEFGATTVVPPGWGVTIDGLGDLVLERV